MKFGIKVVGLRIQQIRKQPENDYVPQKPENLRFAPTIIFYFYFTFLIDMLDNVIYKSVLRHKNSHQW